MMTTGFEIINNISTTGWVVVVGSFLALVISGVIFWQDITRRSSLVFFVLGIVSFLWGLSYAYFEGTAGGASAQRGIQILYLMAALVPVVLFLFFYTFSVEKKEVPLWKLLGIFLPFIMIAGILGVSSEFIIKYVVSQNTGMNIIVVGEGFFAYALYIFAFLSSSIILLIRKYNESAGIFKVAIRRLLIAVSLAYTSSIVMSLLSPIFMGGSELFYGGHIAVIIAIFVMAIIIINYNFWNFKIITTEFFISIIIVTMIAEIFFAKYHGDLIIKTGITILIIISCTFLDGSVKREIQSRDKILHLSRDIDLISRRLKVLDKKKSQFLAVASHHLRDPLTAIKGFSSMLLEGSFGVLPTSVKEAVEKIFESSERLITMVSDFMDISQIESGEMTYSFNDVDVRKLVLDVAEDVKQNADRAHLVLNTVIDQGVSGDTPFVVVGDPGKLRQVISNLFDNSIKYTPKGEVSAYLTKSPDGKKILFNVSDTGIGMSEATIGKIFVKFSRAEGVSKVYTEGTGLGLYVAKEVIKKHDGRIWAESKGEGQGSTFYVELNAKA